LSIYMIFLDFSAFLNIIASVTKVVVRKIVTKTHREQSENV